MEIPGPKDLVERLLGFESWFDAYEDVFGGRGYLRKLFNDDTAWRTYLGEHRQELLLHLYVASITNTPSVIPESPANAHVLDVSMPVAMYAHLTGLSMRTRQSVNSLILDGVFHLMLDGRPAAKVDELHSVSTLCLIADLLGRLDASEEHRLVGYIAKTVLHQLSADVAMFDETKIDVSKLKELILAGERG